MNIGLFLAENNIEYSKGPIDLNMLKQAEKLLGVNFGEQLSEYLLKYGYFAKDFIELFGMTANQGLSSDLVKETLYLHQYFPETRDYVAVENQGEGDYYIVASDDQVYEFDSNLKSLVNTHFSFWDYIMRRLG